MTDTEALALVLAISLGVLTAACFVGVARLFTIITGPRKK